MFGLDVIARLKEELSPLVVHELFHVYHGEAVPEDPETVAWALWSEGLASYVSRRLNPRIPEKDICCMPPVDPVKPIFVASRPSLLADPRQRRIGRSTRGTFSAGRRSTSRRAPGTTVGYRIAEEAGKTRTLEELAALEPDEVRALEDEALGVSPGLRSPMSRR